MSNAPKTAYELAMERLRQKDAEAGIVQESLTDEQKGEIAEVRRVAEARTAELKILLAPPCKSSISGERSRTAISVNAGARVGPPRRAPEHPDSGGQALRTP